VLHVIFAVVVGFICFRLVDVVADLLYKLTERSDSSLNNMIVPIVTTALRMTVVILVVLEIATAISDQPPSAVLAGLGAGGLAIGLAAQETIKNLFGSVMIFADRPFELGERIVVDGHDGPVESVGFRSTRIRTLQGHLVTVPNGEMANKTIQNIGKRSFIRKTMNIRIASDTPPEKIKRALDILRELLDDHEGMQEELPPRVFLEDFLESAINLRAIYWYHPPDYWEFCAFGERLNMLVVEQFLAAEVRFAIPTQQIILKHDLDQFTNVDAKD
jgi:MscS family membrane protein